MGVRSNNRCGDTTETLGTTPRICPSSTTNPINSFPWSSVGNPDACAAIGEPPSNYAFQSCLVSANGPFMRFGLCAPEACTTADVVLGMGATLRQIMPPLPADDPVMVALAATTDCGSEQGFPWTAGTWAVLDVCMVLAVLVFVGTAIDLLHGGWWGRQQEPGMAWGKELLLAFSFPRNWRRLMQPSRAGGTARDEKRGRTAALDGMRSLSMFWVIFGHAWVFAYFITGFSNATTAIAGTFLPMTPDGKVSTHHHPISTGHGFLGMWGGQSVVGAYLAVDTFFFLSALLAVRGLLLRHAPAAATASTRMGPAAAAGTCIKAYLLRYLRLTPAYALVLFFYWLVLGAAGGKGPVWRAAFRKEYGAYSHRKSGRAQGSEALPAFVSLLTDLP